VESAVSDALGLLVRTTKLSSTDLVRARRTENLAACAQGRAWQAVADLATLPAFPFACECGASGCAEVVLLTPDGYDDRCSVTGALVAPGHQ
jgi:hypothetical protein